MHGLLTPTTNLIEGLLTKAIPTAREDAFLDMPSSSKSKEDFQPCLRITKQSNQNMESSFRGQPRRPCWTFPLSCIRFNRRHEMNIRNSHASHVLLEPLETHDQRINGLHSPEGLQRPQSLEKQVARQSFPRLCRYNTLYKTPIIRPRTRKVFPYGLGTNAVGHHWLMSPTSMDSSSPLFEDPDRMDSVGRATWRDDPSCCPPLSPDAGNKLF